MPNHVFLKKLRSTQCCPEPITEWGIFPGPQTENVEQLQKFCLPLPHAASRNAAGKRQQKKILAKKPSASISPSSDDKGRGRQSFPISYGG